MLYKCTLCPGVAFKKPSLGVIGGRFAVRRELIEIPKAGFPLSAASSGALGARVNGMGEARRDIGDRNTERAATGKGSWGF